MSRTVIVGITSSGKTCYFYGMLSQMMRGFQGFSVRVAKEDFSKLRMGMKRLGDTRLPLEERFPVASSEQEDYKMDLLYNLKKIDTFEWVDYPGELAEEGTEQFVRLLEGATCLLLCVDGEAIQGTEEDVDTIVNTIAYEKGGLELCNALMQAEDSQEGGFPPVCIMVTKYDKVSPALRNVDVLTEIMRASFPILFHEGNGNVRMVTICPVTLGKDLENNGRLEPKNVEKPICFANYLIQTALLNNLMQQADEFIKQNSNAVQEYNKRGIIGKMFHPKPTPVTEEQKQAIQTLLNNGKADLDALRSVIEVLPLYIDGEKQEWPA